MLKYRLREFVKLYFIKKNDQLRYKYLVLGRDMCYFVKKNNLILPKSSDIINMLEFLIENLFAMFSGCVFNRQSVYLWVQTVFLFSPACSFIRMRQTSY